MFSKEFLKANFYFADNDVVFFNQGSYGVCPRPVLEEKFNILRKFEENTVMEFAETMFDGCLENTKVLGERIGVSHNNLALVTNVTHGICSVLQSIAVVPGDEMLLTNFTYEAVRMEVEEMLTMKGLVIRTLNLVPPFQSNETICELYTNFVLEYPRIKYAIIDHIPSGLPMVQPVEEIVKSLRKLGVFVIIDGAHAPGQIKDLNVRDIDADVYIGNLYKWCFLPRGTGFVAVREGLDINMKPPVVSFLHQRELYLRYIYMGTNDVSNALCVKSAFEFVDMLGGFGAIYPLIVDTLKRGVSHLETSWGVSSLTFPEMAPYVRLIPLPQGFDKYTDVIMTEVKKPFQRQYYSYTVKKLKFVAPIILINGRMNFRICCHIYNTFEDFEQFAESVLRWLELMDKGDTLECVQ